MDIIVTDMPFGKRWGLSFSKNEFYLHSTYLPSKSIVLCHQKSSIPSSRMSKEQFFSYTLWQWIHPFFPSKSSGMYLTTFDPDHQIHPLSSLLLNYILYTERLKQTWFYFSV